MSVVSKAVRKPGTYKVIDQSDCYFQNSKVFKLFTRPSSLLAGV